jgi:hypothetical protein
LRKLILITAGSFLIGQLIAQDTVITLQSECTEDSINVLKLRERLLSKSLRNDTLILVVAVRENCCSKFMAIMDWQIDTLNIKYDNIGEDCFCPCFFHLTFLLPHFSEIPNEIRFNNNNFEESEDRFSSFTRKIDTLDNGVIIYSEYENGNLIYEIEKSNSTIKYSRYSRGVLIQEYKKER